MNKTEFLRTLIPKLNDRDQHFAESLCNQEFPLSVKQNQWVDKLIERAQNTGPVQTEKVATEGELAGIVDLINRNNKAKWPKISVFVQEIIIQVSRAGEKARHPGTFNIVELSEPFDKQGNFLGRIYQNGLFETRLLDRRASIASALKEFAQDPGKVAAAYGHKTGHCCFCRLALDDPRSLKVGYGPVCAKNYHLPW